MGFEPFRIDLLESIATFVFLKQNHHSLKHVLLRHSTDLKAHFMSFILELFKEF